MQFVRQNDSPLGAFASLESSVVTLLTVFDYILLAAMDVVKVCLLVITACASAGKRIIFNAEK